jgi:hypothetical protein
MAETFSKNTRKIELEKMNLPKLKDILVALSVGLGTPLTSLGKRKADFVEMILEEEERKHLAEAAAAAASSAAAAAAASSPASPPQREIEQTPDWLKRRDELLI